MTDIKVIPRFHCLNKSSHGSFADTAVTSSSPTLTGTIISFTLVVLFYVSPQSCTSSVQYSEP